MRKRLSEKQQVLVSVVKKNPELTLDQISKQTGYSDRSTVHRALNSPAVKSHFEGLLETRPKLSDEKFLDHLESGLEAKNGSYPDWSNRHKYWRDWGKMKGHIKDDAPRVTNNFLALFDQAYEQYTKQAQIPH